MATHRVTINLAAHDPVPNELALAELVGGGLSPRFNGGPGEVYLARSWLGQIHESLLWHDPDATHHDRLPTAGRRQRLVAIANRLGLDVEELLAAEPEREVRMVYGAVAELA